MVRLRNLPGQEVASYRYDGGRMMTIATSSLPAGTYLLEAETPGGISIQRFPVVR